MNGLIKAAKAISDETRLRILSLLLQRECCVCEVMLALKISQTRASRNLSMLHDAGFLKLRKAGLWAHYSIDRERPADYLASLLQAVERGTAGNRIIAEDEERLNKIESPASTCCKLNQSSELSGNINTKAR